MLTFKAPSYTFYYDQDGNVLKKKPEKDPTLTEQLENILYTLRDDGLYQDANGKLYANVYNYAKLYKDASAQYFDKDKNPVGFNNLVKGQTYYKADGTEANGYLVLFTCRSVGKVNVCNGALANLDFYAYGRIAVCGNRLLGTQESVVFSITLLKDRLITKPTERKLTDTLSPTTELRFTNIRTANITM